MSFAAWQSTVYYVLGDTVTYNPTGDEYIASASSLNAPPPISPGSWTLVSPGGGGGGGITNVTSQTGSGIIVNAIGTVRDVDTNLVSSTLDIKSSLVDTSVAINLNTIVPNVSGSYTNANITVDASGLVTVASSGTVQLPAYLSAENSTLTQTINPGPAVFVTHDTFTLSFNITPVGPAPYTRFQVSQKGVYKILYSLQLNGGGNGEIAAWVNVNNNPVANSSTYTAFKNNDRNVLTCEYLLNLNAGDAFGFEVATIGAPCNLEVIPPSPSPPGITGAPISPSVITNVYRIA